MDETPLQYTQRLLGYVRGLDPVKILAATPGKITKLVRGKTRQSLAKRLDPDKWSVVEILAHLADSELVVGYRIRLMLGASGIDLQAYDQETWADFSHHAKSDPKLSFDAFRVQRERTVRLLKELTPEQWEKFGIHSERGKETVRRTVEMLAGHDINHLAQIEKIMMKSAKSRK